MEKNKVVICDAIPSSLNCCGYCYDSGSRVHDLRLVQLRLGIKHPWQWPPRYVCLYCRAKLGGTYFRYVKQYDPKKKKAVIPK